jgi:anaerobic ribonucleoside-triphosphate reductase
MSFARLFRDSRSKWGVRGQYAIWTGSRSPGEEQYRLLERLDHKIIPVAWPNGGQVMHRIAAETEFTIENLMGYWLKFGVDSIWLDIPSSTGSQYCVLIVGGSSDKPDRANVGWICPKCGSSLASEAFERPLRDLEYFLNAADKFVEKFNAETGLRTCHGCGAIHPPSYALVRDGAGVSAL